MSVYDDAVLADEPELYAKLEELTPPPPAPNTACTDSSGNGHHGTLLPNSDGGLIQGIAGPIETDGTSYGMSGGIARIPNTGDASGALEPGGTRLALEAWVKNSGAGVQMIFSHHDDTASTFMSIGQPHTGNFPNRVVLSLEIDSVEYGITSDVLSVGPWHHVVGFRNQFIMGVFLDGCLSNSRLDIPGDEVFTFEAAPWRLGYMTNLAFGAVNRSAGLSRAAIYIDRVLTSTRVFAHWQAAHTATQDPCPVPSGYRFDCTGVDLEVA